VCGAGARRITCVPVFGGEGPCGTRDGPQGGRRPRVLLVAPQPFFRFTGTPLSTLAICRALSELGFEVHVATLPGGQDVAVSHLTLHRVPRLPLMGYIPVGFSVGKALYDVLLAGLVCLLLLRSRFAAVHAFEEAAFYSIPLARMFGVPGIIDLDSDLCQQLRGHGSWLAWALARPAGWLRRRALRQATGALSMGQRTTVIVRAESPTTPVFQVLDTPIESALRRPDLAKMKAYREELGLEANRLVVYTGNYDRRQGLEALVQAMPAVLRRHPDAALLIVGGGAAEVRALQQRIDALGLAGAARLIGCRPPETMAEYMCMAEVLVSPRLEAFVTPLKIFSYMASGRPIVATDLPTHTEVLSVETAVLTPPTVAGLAQGISRALDEPTFAARLGERARSVAESEYTYSKFKQQLSVAYTALVYPRLIGSEVSPPTMS
jgi:glycosyltransferase involved in cell wall biosynthesis